MNLPLELSLLFHEPMPPAPRSSESYGNGYGNRLANARALQERWQPEQSAAASLDARSSLAAVCAAGG